VDRIERFSATSRRFEVARGFDFDAYVGASFGVIAEPATRVRIAFDPRWATYVSEHTWHESQRLGPLPGGGLELAMEVGGTAELRQWILSFGSGAEVLEPAALRDEVTRGLTATLTRYAPTPSRRKRS
jgi:predicted DNA-binding transcriptional regulator YafY